MLKRLGVERAQVVEVHSLDEMLSSHQYGYPLSVFESTLILCLVASSMESCFCLATMRMNQMLWRKMFPKICGSAIRFVETIHYSSHTADKPTDCRQCLCKYCNSQHCQQRQDSCSRREPQDFQGPDKDLHSSAERRSFGKQSLVP